MDAATKARAGSFGTRFKKNAIGGLPTTAIALGAGALAYGAATMAAQKSNWIATHAYSTPIALAVVGHLAIRPIADSAGLGIVGAAGAIGGLAIANRPRSTATKGPESTAPGGGPYTNGPEEDMPASLPQGPGTVFARDEPTASEAYTIGT